jgi:chitinase
MKYIKVPNSFFMCVVACLALLVCFASSATAQTTTSSSGLTKRLIADYGYWSQTQTPPYSSAQIPYNEVTHINHAGVSFDANGNLIIPSGFIEKALLTKAHNHGVKVMLLLGGDFTGMETTAGGLAALLVNLQSFLQEYGYDGVDIDWEYPATAQDTTFFHALMLGLRSILPSPQLLSADVAPWGGTGYDFPDTQLLVDWFNIMTYDCAGPWTDSAQLNSAIFPDPNDPESYNCEPGGSVKEAIDIYTLQLQIPPSQLNIGTPFYGYVYHQANALWGYCPDQNKAQDCGGSVDYENYGTFFKPRLNAMGWRTYYDPISLVPYMLKADGSEGFITYDDASSTFYRVWYTDWSRGLGGTFIWEIDADYDGTTQDLLDAAFNASQVQTP